MIGLIATTVGVLMLSTGCSGVDPSFDALALADLPCQQRLNGGDLWESAPWFDSVGSTDNCPWFDYDGRLTLDVAHDLGRVPASIQLYVSFSSSGESAALVAGDLLRIVDVSDSVVVIKNDSNQDFFGRLVLH